MKNKILAFGLCVAVFLSLFNFAVSAGSAQMAVSNLYTTEEGYSFDLKLNAQSVSGYIFVAKKNADGAFDGVQVYDAQSTVTVEVSKDYTSATVFWWDVFNTMKPMVKQLAVDLSAATEKPPLVLNDIEDGGLLKK